jgi:hypothetical protein
LNGDDNATIQTITVGSTAGASAAGHIKIEDEIIEYTGKTGTTFTGCTRGTCGTTAAAHTNGKGVVFIDDYELEPRTREVEASGLNLLWVDPDLL